ncbi:TOPRIM domain protein [Sinorhizobium sp. CCBAU 05631]|nr:TOPRIM domain protein [Sinorhizobium sp. CCBAU 05631]
MAARWKGFTAGKGVTLSTVAQLARDGGADLSAIATKHRGGERGDWISPQEAHERAMRLAATAAAKLVTLPEQASDNIDVPAEPRAFSIFEWPVSRFVGEAPAVKYLVDDVIPLGIPGMVSAMGDTGKSFALLELHRRVAFGQSTFAAPIFGGKVIAEGTSVMITSEDDANEVHRRIAALDEKGMRFTEAGQRMIVVPLPSAGGACAFWREDKKKGLIETDDFLRIQDELASIRDLRLVTFDPLASFAHLPLNEDPAAGQFVCTSLSKLATETGATTLVAHHMRKVAKPIETLGDARDAIRGSTALVDGLRLAYAMWPAEEARAKRVCKDLGTDFQPAKVVLGGVVKANGAARRIVSTHVRNAHGLLVDRAAGLGASAPPQDDLRAALVIAVEAAAAAGSPFTKTGASGLFEMRERLPEELRGLAKGKLDLLANQALERGEIVRAAAKGEKIAKWLDAPGGMFAIGLGSFTTGTPRS